MSAGATAFPKLTLESCSAFHVALGGDPSPYAIWELCCLLEREANIHLTSGHTWTSRTAWSLSIPTVSSPCVGDARPEEEVV